MSNEEIDLNRDWNIDINMSGLNAPTGAKNMEVPEGYYKAKVTDMYVNPERNPNRVILKMTISEGPFTGTVRTGGLNIPKSDDDKVRYYWRGLAESAGYTPTQLDAGSIQLGRDTFLDREVHIHFTPKSDSSQWEQVDYLPPAEWNQQRQVFDAANRSETGAVTPAPSADGGNSTAGGILGKLGVEASA
jgi:hypothetical protein